MAWFPRNSRPSPRFLKLLRFLCLFFLAAGAPLVLNLAAAQAAGSIPAAGTWGTTGSLGTARNAHTVTLLPNGKVLVVGGYGSSGMVLNSAELYDPDTGTWDAASPLMYARAYHTATLLPDGKVLVAGGSDTFSVPMNSAELYDPDAAGGAGLWLPTNGPLATARQDHTATLLPNGKVLLAGGGDGAGSLAGAEIFNPATGYFTGTGPLANARYNHTATLLPNGKVLVVGGYGYPGDTLNSAELFDPAAASGAGAWTATSNINGSRAMHTATLLPNGLVMISGGWEAGFLQTECQLYDPATEAWDQTGYLDTARYRHTATLLPNGKVLVAGGMDEGENALASAELYDPYRGAWEATGDLATARGSHTATRLPNGQILAVGGVDGANYLDTAEVYASPPATWAAATATWVYTNGPLATGRMSHTATLLPNGLILVAGGIDSGSLLDSAELYDPDGESWSATGSLNVARHNHTATLLPNGKVLVVGGNGVTEAELYDPATGTWTLAPSPVNMYWMHTATLLPNGQVLVIEVAAELFDPAANDGAGGWTPAASLNNPRAWHTATLLPNGLVLVAGGNFTFTETRLASAECYDPATETWSATGPLNSARYGHTATLLPNGLVLAAGGDDGNDNTLPSAELYGKFYTITATAGTGGSISPSGTVFVEEGMDQDFTITPAAD